MAADNINNIIDVSGFDADLGKVLTGISTLEAKMQEANGNAIQVIIDSKSLDTLNRLTSATEAQTKAQQDFNGVAQENVTIVQQLNQVEQTRGAGVADTVRLLAVQRQELQQVNNTLLSLSKAKAESAEHDLILAQRIETLVAKQQKLKASISEGTASLRGMSTATKETSEAVTVMGVNVESVFARMAVRMVIMQLAFEPIIAGITAAVAWFTKLSDAEQLATDKLKDYDDQMKQTAAIAAGEKALTTANIIKERQEADRLISTLADEKATRLAKLDAIKQLQALQPGLLNGYKEETLLNLKNTQGIQDHSDAITNLEGKISALNKTYDAQVDIFSKTKDKADELKKTYGDRWMEGDKTTGKNFTEQLDALTKSGIELDSLKRELANINSPEPKEKKPKKEKAEPNDLNAMLSAEKAIYERRLQENKDYYESTKRTYADEEKLNADNVQAAQEYGEKAFQIVNSFHIKTYKDYLEFVKQTEEIQKELLAADTKYSVEEKKILDKIVSDREDAQKQIAKFLEEQYTLLEKARELEDAQKSAAAYHKYAQGSKPFLEELFGVDTSSREAINEINRQIKQKEEQLEHTNKKLQNAKNDNDQPNIDKYTVAAQDQTDDLAKLELDKQKIQDDELINLKKKLADQTIKLAQETFAAIKTIRDNEFAAEQQQLQIKMQSVNLQYDQQVQAINATTGYQITKDNELAKLAAQHAAEQNAIQQQENNLALRKAKADKQAAEAEILANTAVGIVKALAEYGYAGIPLAALIAATGAVQYAAAASTPLPQYAVGTEGTTSTHFIAGEQGPELMTMPGGKTMLADKPGIYSAPIGTKINTADETAAFMRYAQHSMSLSINGRGELKESAPSMTDKGIIEAIHDSNNEVVNAIYRNRTNVNIRVASDYRVWKR